MATEGTSGEKPPPVQTLATASHGSLEARCEFNVDNLSKPELLTLLSIMEGELEARDLVIEALRARRKETFIQERYACFTLTDPFLALQRDGQPGGGDKEGRSLGTSPISVLEAMMAHCRKMQEKMSAQLAAAEVRQKKLEQEREQLQGLQQEHRRLTAQLKDEREKNKHIVTMLVRECRQLAARVVEESQRFEELSARFQEEGKASGQLEKELKAERQKGQEMEARMEKQLSEMDVEREQLRASLGREEARCAELKEERVGLSRQLEELRTKRAGKAPAPTSTTPAAATAPKATASVAVETDPANLRTSSCQTDPMPLAVPTKTLGGNYGTAPLPKTGVHSGMPRGQAYSCPGGLLQSENGPSGAETLPTFVPATPIHGLHSPGTPTGVSPRVQAARYKFQTPPSEQDQNGTGSQSPRSREASPSSRDLVAKQQARHTVTQVLSRFTSPPAGGGALRPGLPHSASEGGPFPGRLGHGQIKSPTAGKVDRGNPPPVPPKKPGLSQASAAPHPPIKGAGDGSRSPGSAVGVPSKPGTPMLPPKPALDIAGTGGASPVPALTASQVGAHPPLGPEPQWKACAECHPVTVAVVSSPPINPVSASSCRPSCDSDRPLAAASGWTSSIDSSLPRGDPASLAGGRTLLLEAATQGNVTLLSMLLNPDPKDIIHNCEDTNAALFSAAQNGNTECIELLLATGASAEASDANGLTALHMAAAHGQHRCIELLLGVTADVNQVTSEGQSALFLASASDNPECVRALLDAGAHRSLATTDGETALHAAAAGGHFGSVELLLYHPSRQESSLLNFCNRDGWTPAFVAAANGYKKCLELLCGHSPHDLEQRDACNRTIHHVATDDCKNLLENLYSYRVLVRIQRGSEEQICMVDVMEDGPTVGVVTVHKETRWDELCRALTGTLTSHFHLLTSGEDGGRDLGLNADSISSILIGNVVWNMDQEPSQSPWDLVRKCHCQHITVKLKGLQESALDELAYDSLIPLHLLNNYVRLVEQYRNVILHGLEGSCQGYIANQIAFCIKHRLEAQGVGCDIITVEMEEDLSKEQLLETFINCGFLVPVSQAAAAGRSAVLILEGLEKVHSLSELLGDLCDSLETRGVAYPVPLLHAQEGCCLHQFQEGGFLIGTLSKPHLQGAELLLQQHFRWVQLRWDSEPLAGLLTRHLRRKLVHKTKGQVPARSDVLWRTMAWVCSVWQQLNSCVSRLGTPEALMGPQMFLSCPVIPGQTQAVVKWLTRLWNLVVVPRVEEAVISRVTARKSVAQQQSPGNGNLSANQQAVVKAALSILVNKVILHGCPLPRPEIDKHLTEFRGSRFPLSTLGSYKGGGRRKGRDSAAWRRANTSPRKKSSSPLSAWGSGGGLREGSLSSNDLLSSGKSVTPQSCAGEEPTRFSLVSDDETDLMLQLQTMCSSKSEPDIRKIPPSCEDFIMFTGARSGQTTLNKDTAEPDQTQAKERCPSSSHAPGAPSCEKRTARPKSQLPVPSSKSIQGTQSSGSISRASSKTRHAPPSNNHSQSQDIWILQRDSHANNNK